MTSRLNFRPVSFWPLHTTWRTPRAGFVVRVSGEGATPRGRSHCNDLRSEHRSSVIAARPPSRDQARVLRRGVPASLATLRHSTAEETSHPGGRSPSGALRRLQGRCDGRFSRAAHPEGRAPKGGGRSGCRHSWRYTLTQCRARQPLLGHSNELPRHLRVLTFRRGAGSLPTVQVADALGSLSLSLSGEGRICVALSVPCGPDVPVAAALTPTHRPGGSRALSSSRAIPFPQPRTFGPWPTIAFRCRDD